MNKRILHLTLKKKWFDLIADGKKKVEYREIKPYWTNRLILSNQSAKVFDEIHFRNGYNKDNPFMRVEWGGLHKDIFEGKKCFAIFLGKILEIKNYQKEI